MNKSKAPLSPKEMRSVIDLSLWVGQLLLQYGADAQRTEETVHRFGTAMGCDWLDVLVSYNGLTVSTSSGGQFRTRARRVVQHEVDIALVADVNALSRRVEAGTVNRKDVRKELERLSTLHPLYSPWIVAPAIGLACGAFSHLFGGDWSAFFITVVASTVAALVGQLMKARVFNQFLTTIVTAFVAGILASSSALFGWSSTPQIPLAASVLLLVPGVPLINGVEDLLHGHVNIGGQRLLFGAIIAMGIAIGLSLALYLTRVALP